MGWDIHVQWTMGESTGTCTCLNLVSDVYMACLRILMTSEVMPVRTHVRGRTRTRYGGVPEGGAIR